MTGWFALLREKISEVGTAELATNSMAEKKQSDESESPEQEAGQYLDAISDLGTSVDTSSRRVAVVGAAKAWLKSPEGGQRFAARNLLLAGGS